MKPLPVVPPLDLPSRREVLQWIGIGSAALLIPGCRPKAGTPASSPPSLRFLTQEEAKALGALADAIFPPDADPGASALGAVTYIDRLLSAFDPPTPEVHAAGPYSNRQPYAAADGTASKNYPTDGFATFLPLDRYAEASWRLYLYGSDAVGGGPNDTALGKVIGLRDQIRNGLQQVMTSASPPLAQQTPAQVSATLNTIDPDFRDLLVSLVSQGIFAAPEYGGNLNGGGWKIAHFEGDIQPLGYSLFDTTSNSYKEQPDAPVSGPNPGSDPAPLDDTTRNLISTAVAFLGGQQFS